MKLIVRHDGVDTEVEVERYGGGYCVSYDGKSIVADVQRANLFLSSLSIDGDRQYLLGHAAEGSRHTISFGDQALHVEVFDPLSLKRRRREDEAGGGGGMIKALMPGRVIRVLVEEGATVTKGTGLLILEAMKMENEIVAMGDGVVSRIVVNSGDTVDSGADLILIE